MPARDKNQLEELLAEALAAHDKGGDAALQAFVDGHPADRTRLERGLLRCRQMGLLGDSGPVRDFPEQLGEFRLLRRLGSGGMGVVYEAEQRSLGRRVALKVVRPELLYFEGARERFRREIEAVARLSHPGVVPVLASGEQEGVPWYAMELLHGRTVHEVCTALAGRDPALLRGADLRAVLGASTETGTNPYDGAWWQVCARIAHAVALGVRHAHLRGIVHRDIKPSNIMLTAEGRTVLLDFGVALVGGSREFTRTGNTPGSPAFMSPEQLRGDAVDERTDVYSLGASLWQMLALVPPFPGQGDLQRIRDGELPSLAAKNREVPRELELVVRTAMDRDRDRRYADVEAFAEDLMAVLQRRPIRARRLSLSLRLVRWCQRHRVAATALASLLLTALLLPAAFAWRERATNRALQTAAAVADESLSTTLDAIYALLVRVGDDKLRYVPAAGKVALESLHDACAMYRTLLHKHGDHVRVRVDAGKTMSRYSDLLLRNGDGEGAVAILREAIGHLGGESAAVPLAVANARAFLWLNLASTASSLRDRTTAARALDATARDLDRVGEAPAFRLHQQRLRIRLLVVRADLLDPQLEAGPMERLYRDALALARQLHADRPDDAGDAQQVVTLLDQLATLLSKHRRFEEAVPLLEEALSLARAIPGDAHIWPPPPLAVADVLETLGNLHVARRDARAPAALKECLQLREAASRDHPGDVQIRSELGAALHNLATMNFYQEQDDLALERLDRAIGLQRQVVREMPSLDQGREYLRNHLILRGSTLAKLGRATELQATAEELSAMQQDPGAQRSAARLWLRLVALLDQQQPPPADAETRRASFVQRALALLLAAERLGWGPGNPFAEAVYDPLRSLPEFAALQARIAEATRAARDGSTPTKR